MGIGQSYERVIVKMFNEYFKKNDIKAIAWRLPQVMYKGQVFDVFIDSLLNQYYSAIECKNIDISKNHFYLSSVIKSTDVFEQLRFLKLSGRNGYYFINLRNKRNQVTYLIPINSIFTLLKNKRFDEELTLNNGGCIVRNNGDVNLSCFNYDK